MPSTLRATDVVVVDAVPAGVGGIERFVLGSLSQPAVISAVADETGIQIEDLIALLGPLVDAGVVRVQSTTQAAPVANAPPMTSPEATLTIRGQRRRWSPQLLEDKAELPLTLRFEVLDLHQDLEVLDHYELLGVERTADRRAIKAAYYGLAARLHPDRYFGKELGPFKARLEAVFSRLTSAHDTLVSPPRREEYDAYLRDLERTRAFERYLADADVGPDGGSSAPPPVGPGVRPSQVSPSPSRPPAATGVGAGPSPVPTRVASRPSSAPPVTPRPSVPPAVASRPPSVPPAMGARPSPVPTGMASPSLGGVPRPSAGRPSTPVATPSKPPAGSGSSSSLFPNFSDLEGALTSTPARNDQERRAALARRLGHRGGPPAARPAEAPPTESALTPAAARELLRRRYEDSLQQARTGHVRRSVEAAEAALAREDYVEAANQYRAAARFSNDSSINAKLAEVTDKARAVMAEAYAKQARYEEQAQRWAAAAASYTKAVENRPNAPELCERAAHALRLAKDLHRAAKMGEEAVRLAPHLPRYRVDLAQIYLEAGLVLRARSELEQALKLDPENTVAKDLLSRTRRVAS